jgi:hypothetical protein
MSMTDNDGTQLQGEQLSDGIVFEQTPNWLKFACPKGKAKERTLKLVDSEKSLYEVPKSDVFFYGKVKLADGSTVTLLRYKAIPQNEREAFHSAAVKAGLKVKPLTAAPKNEKPAKLTFASIQ